MDLIYAIALFWTLWALTVVVAYAVERQRRCR